MHHSRLLALMGLLFLSGCLYHAKEETDQIVGALAAHPFDLQPSVVPEASTPAPSAATGAAWPSAPPGPAIDVQTSALMEAEQGARPEESTDIRPVAFLQADQLQDKDATLKAIQERLEKLKIPSAVPGSETPPIKWPKDPAEQAAMIRQLYPPLPPLPEEPKPLPGPNGHPYTLAELQQMAADHSWALHQAATDVVAARANLIQAGAYPNPKFSLQIAPSSNGSTPGVWGVGVDQVVKTGGKLGLQYAAAEIDLRNSELALRRARSDLATRVRNAYYGVLVAQETVRVTKALARFTDEVYLAQADALRSGLPAPYEPAALQSQAWTVRLALQQAIASYISSWHQLVAALSIRQLPLTEVAGRIDRAIPYYDFDTVRSHVLHNHTDVLTARNGIEKARYNLKLAQITPLYPDVEFTVAVQKDFVVPPQQVAPTATVSVPLPIWDTNKGNILAAEATLDRARDEPHRVEMSLTASLDTAYTNYKNNLLALEYYRRFILPAQVRTYRGIFDRRRIDLGFGFVDLVTAQQSLVTNVTTYLGVLGTLWTSVVSVADLLQTDDLFQVGHPHDIPALPNLEALPPWLCDHGFAPLTVGQPVGACGGSVVGTGSPGPAGPAPSGDAPPPGLPDDAPTLPAPRLLTPPEAPTGRR
jgi:cobalt-zinc-cadmium efflux system outer membrane protein